METFQAIGNLYTSDGKESNEPIEERLDKILEFAKSFNDRNFNRLQLNQEFRDKYFYSLDLLLNYLIEEGFITEPRPLVTNDGERIVETLHYTLKLKGEMFKGYAQTREERLSETKRIKKQDDQIRLLTLLLAIGSIGVLIIEAMKFILDYSY